MSENYLNRSDQEGIAHIASMKDSEGSLNLPMDVVIPAGEVIMFFPEDIKKEEFQKRKIFFISVALLSEGIEQVRKKIVPIWMVNFSLKQRREILKMESVNKLNLTRYYFSSQKKYFN